VALPERARLTQGELRPTVAEVRSRRLDSLRRVMKDPSNWVSLSEFPYERALSDYIGAYPHLLEDGLLPHPNNKVRERLFRDRSRLDVLLEDGDGIAVIVECKQRQPSLDNVRQLQHYLTQFRREEALKVRGILVHGGAQKLRSEVRRAAKKRPKVELVQFSIGVDFSRSG
jgi:RecB family endonuclease NucS